MGDSLSRPFALLPARGASKGSVFLAGAAGWQFDLLEVRHFIKSNRPPVSRISDQLADADIVNRADVGASPRRSNPPAASRAAPCKLLRGPPRQSFSLRLPMSRAATQVTHAAACCRTIRRPSGRTLSRRPSIAAACPATRPRAIAWRCRSGADAPFVQIRLDPHRKTAGPREGRMVVGARRIAEEISTSGVSAASTERSLRSDADRARSDRHRIRPRGK